MRRHGVWLVPLVLVLLAIGWIPQASAHAYLDASTPAPNGNATNGTSVLALRFTEVMDPDHTRATIEGPEGPIQPTDLDVPPDRPRVLRVEVEPLPPGSYELTWTSFSIDSHVDRGRLAFSVGSASLEDPVEPQPRQPGLLDPGLSFAETFGRVLFLLGALVAVGLPIYLSEVEPEDRALEAGSPLVVGAGVTGALGSLILIGVLVARLQAPLMETLATLPGLYMIGKTLLLATVAGVGLGWRSQGPLGGRSRIFLVVIPAVLALVLHSMSGHGVLEAASRRSAAGHFAMTVHLVAAGLWLGGLVGLVSTTRSVEGLVERIQAFTPLAVASVVALAATGLVQAFFHLPTVSALWTSGFGWALVVKTLLFGVVLLFGAWHGFALPKRLASGLSDRLSFQRSGRAEVVALGGVILAAAVMGVLPVPEEGIQRDPGPRAVFEEGGSLPGYDYRLALLEDPIRAEEPIPAELRIRSTSSASLADVTVNASLEGPQGHTEAVAFADAEPTGPADTARLWRSDPVRLPVDGNWTVTVRMDLPTGTVTERIPVTVLPPS